MHVEFLCHWDKLPCLFICKSFGLSLLKIESPVFRGMCDCPSSCFTQSKPYLKLRINFRREQGSPDCISQRWGHPCRHGFRVRVLCRSCQSPRIHPRWWSMASCWSPSKCQAGRLPLAFFCLSLQKTFSYKSRSEHFALVCISFFFLTECWCFFYF